jgi:Trypsin-co-occurring domain 1
MQTLKFGEVEVQVVTVKTAGSEQTSAISKAKDATTDLFGHAQFVIEAFADQVGGTIAKIRNTIGSPDEVQVELGLSFSASGNVLIASSTGEASIRVTFTYKAKAAEGAS